MAAKFAKHCFRLNVERVDGSTEVVFRVDFTEDLARRRVLDNANRVRILACRELTPEEYEAAKREARAAQKVRFGESLRRHFRLCAAKAAARREAAAGKGVRPC